MDVISGKIPTDYIYKNSLGIMGYFKINCFLWLLRKSAKKGGNLS